jgi:hypothetical protein
MASTAARHEARGPRVTRTFQYVPIGTMVQGGLGHLPGSLRFQLGDPEGPAGLVVSGDDQALDQADEEEQGDAHE